MPRRSSSLRPGLFLLALAIAAILWGMAHGSSTIERGYDLPVVFTGVPESLVITEQSADVVNIRVLGSPAALRDISARRMEYVVRVDGGKPGPAVYEVDKTQIELPRGVRIVSRSPAALKVEFERRGRRSVRVRPDLEGQPPEGFRVSEVTVAPPRVWLAGARSDVLRLSEVVTETIDLSALAQTTERKVRLSLGGGHVWMEESKPVAVRIQIEPIQIEPEATEEEEVEPARRGG